MLDKNILIVEDQESIQTMVTLLLNREGYDVISAKTGEDALELVKSILPDLILLDIILPGIDGFEVCKHLKTNSKTRHIPIIILTSKESDEDTVCGLEYGADDYVAKTTGHSVLLARIKNALKKNADILIDNSDVIKIDNLIIDKKKLKVFVMDKYLPLNQTEFKTLSFLASLPGQVVTREQIINAVKDDDYFSSERYVDTIITNLRKKLGTYGSYIKTIHGLGYSLEI